MPGYGCPACRRLPHASRSMEENKMTRHAATEVAVIDPSSHEGQVRAALKKLVELTAKVDRDRPDPAALKELRQLLEDIPEVARLIMDLAETNIDKVITAAVKGNTAVEALKRNARSMREGMGYADASPMEQA